MTIWRGNGGGGDATTDSELTALAALTQQASGYAGQAAASASEAADSASGAASSAASATSSASSAATSESNAAGSASAAATSAAAAAASAVAVRTIDVSDASPGLRVTQRGTGHALLVEDAANPDASPFVVDQNGSVGVGTPTPDNVKVHVRGASVSKSWVPNGNTGVLVENIIAVANLASGNASEGRLWFSDTDAEARGAVVYDHNTDHMRLVVAGNERLRIDSAGGVGIGSTALAGHTLRLGKSLTGGTTAYGVYAGGAVQSDVTTAGYGFRSDLATAAVAFTLPTLGHFLATQNVIGAGSSVTNQYGFFAQSNLTGAANNFGFYGNIPAGAGRWNFYANGDAPNYMKGSLQVDGGATMPSQNGGPLAGLRNRIINGGFNVNQRAVTGTVTLAAGAYGHDRWKAGASGCTYTYTYSTVTNITTITISAGSLQQVVEGVNMYSGSHVLSWQGTAQGRINSGAYGTSGTVTATGNASLNTTVEFGVGTVSKVMFEEGTVPTVFENRPYGLELMLCQRYLEYVTGTVSGYAASATIARAGVPFKVTKRATPSLGAQVTGSAYVNNLGGNPLVTSYTLNGSISTTESACVDFNTGGTFTSGQGAVVFIPVGALSFVSEL